MTRSIENPFGLVKIALGAILLVASVAAALAAGGHFALFPEDDIRAGLAPAELWEHRLGEPGRAMRELRAELAELKATPFAAA